MKRRHIQNTTYKILSKIRLRTWIALGILFTILPIVLLMALRPTTSEAAWFNDSFSYRRRFSFTHNQTLTNQRITITIDTATLIDDFKMQPDCDDIRFTTYQGFPLRFQLTGICDDENTTFDVVIPNVINGSNVGFVYYGNPQARVATQDVSEFTFLSPSGGGASLNSEEKGRASGGHWPFDEGQGNIVNDASLSNNQGYITGASWQTKDMCLSGKCLYFDGSDDYVTVGYDPAIDEEKEIAGGFTFETWIRPNGPGEGTGGQIFYKDPDTWLRVSNLSNGYLDLVASLNLTTTDATVTASAKIKDNQWNLVSMTYTDDADDEITLWVNGVAVATSTNGVGSPRHN